MVSRAADSKNEADGLLLDKRRHAGYGFSFFNLYGALAIIMV